jgi:hypothetical protein
MDEILEEKASEKKEMMQETSEETKLQEEVEVTEESKGNEEVEIKEETKEEKPEKGIKKFLRKSRKFTDILLIGVIFSIIIIYGGQILASIIINIPAVSGFAVKAVKDLDIAYFLIQYFAFAGIWVFFAIFTLVFKPNWRIFKNLFYSKDGNTIRGALIGLGLGFAFNGFLILMSILLGNVKITFNSINVPLIIAFFVAVLIQSGAEEIVARNYLYQKLRRRYKSPWVAIIGNAVLFMALHLFNNGINIKAIFLLIVISIFFSLIIYQYNSLWACITFHAAWNYTQNILFGLPNSGIVSKFSIFKLDAVSATNGFFYDTLFGVEGSIGAVLLLIAAIAVMIIFGRKRGEKKDLWADKN